jgi:hypothetical protein
MAKDPTGIFSTDVDMVGAGADFKSFEMLHCKEKSWLK